MYHREGSQMRSGKSFVARIALAFALVGLALVPAASADHPVADSSLLEELADSASFLSVGVQQNPAFQDPPIHGVPTNHNGKGQRHSLNFRKLDREPIIDRRNELRAEGTDLAFRNRLMVAGSYEGTGFFRMNKSRTNVEQISFHSCPGSQGDVSIMGDYVFVSIDSPSSNEEKTPTCNNTRTNGRRLNESPSSLEAEGIRILDISNLQNPRQVGFVETECGSHTHTIIPKGRGKAFLYVDSYPIANVPVLEECSELSHDEGEFSVVKFDSDRPGRARVVSTPDVIKSPQTDAIGCHDTGVLLRKNKPDLAACSGLGRWVLLNVERPADPKVYSMVNNARIELDHSAAFSWDGKVAVIGDEHAGAAGGGGCSTNSQSPVGAMWFYDIRNPRNPILRGHHSLPRVPIPDSAEESERFRCTTHNYNILPTKDRDRYLAAVPYYMGGVAVVNFSNPSKPREAGFFLPEVRGTLPDMWSGYWYNGKIFTNEHASQLGVSIFERSGTGRRNVRFFSGAMNPQTQKGPFK